MKVVGLIRILFMMKNHKIFKFFLILKHALVGVLFYINILVGKSARFGSLVIKNKGDNFLI